MPFIGNRPSAVPLTSADITDNIIVNADINSSAAIALSKLATTGTLTFASTIGVGGATPAASGAGITFPATQSVSSDANTLDDYEEGTFTATFTSTGASFSYSFQNGFYTKIGRSVHCIVIVRAQSSGTLTNQLFITGFPFTSANTNGNFASVTFGQFFNVDYPTSSNFINGLIEPNESKIALQTSNDDSGTTVLTAASIDGAVSSGFILGINYFV